MFGGTNDMGLSIAHEKAVGLIFMIIMAAGLLVNIAVIVVFVWKKKYRISHHLAYLNLAVSDTAMALFAVSIRGPGDILLLNLLQIFVTDRITSHNIANSLDLRPSPF